MNGLQPPEVVRLWLRRSRSDLTLGQAALQMPGVLHSVDETFALSQYAVQTRYPGEWEPVTQEEATLALERAAMVLAWVEDQIAQ